MNGPGGEEFSENKMHLADMLELWAGQMYVYLLDLVKNFPTGSFFAKIRFDAAENEPLKVCQKSAKS